MQDSTRYEKTAKLLERFDPDYVPATPRKQQQQHALRAAYIPGMSRAPGQQLAVQFPCASGTSKPQMHAGEMHVACKMQLHTRRQPQILQV